LKKKANTVNSSVRSKTFCSDVYQNTQQYELLVAYSSTLFDNNFIEHSTIFLNVVADTFI